MAPGTATAVVEDPRYRDHRGPTGHPERPDRLVAVGEAIAARADELERVAPREAGSAAPQASLDSLGDT